MATISIRPELSEHQQTRQHPRAFKPRNFVGFAFSILPFLACITWLGASANRTYGPSHWFANYRHGFLRRALVGEVFSHVPYLAERTVHRLELAIFATVCLITLFVFRRILFGTISERRFAAFLLVAPAFLPHMAYMSGEMDSFLYITLLLGAFALMRLPSLVGLAVATAFSVLGLLIHEGFALMFYPLILVLALDLVQQRKLKGGWVAIHLGIVLAAFAAIVHLGKLPGTPEQWIAEAQQRTDMRIDGTVFLVLHSNLRQQLELVRHLYTARVLASILATLAISLPYFVVLTRLLRTTFALRGYSRELQFAMIALFAAPLGLSIVGHDMMRWLSALCINLSLYLLLVYRSTPSQEYSLDGGLHEALTGWTAVPAYAATLGYLIALGPWGIASNRLISNLGNLLGH